MPAIINSDDGVLSGSSGLKTSGANDGITAFQQNGTERMRITAAGDVGIGTSSPAQRLVTETADGLISIGPSGWRATERASILMRTKTNNPAEIDLQNTNSGLNYGWQISSRETNTPTLDFYSNSNLTYTLRARITSTGDFQFNSGYGSVATAYGCRAWVNFNGTGTVAIRASGNVTSITDNGTGDYTLNFTTAMPDTNYAVFGTGVNPSDQGGVAAVQIRIPPGFGSAATLKSTTQVRMLNRRDADLDIAEVNVAIFR